MSDVTRIKLSVLGSHPTIRLYPHWPLIPDHGRWRGSIAKRHRKLEREEARREEKHSVDEMWILQINIHISTTHRRLGADMDNMDMRCIIG